MCPSTQCNGRWSLAASLAEVPLINWQCDVQAQVKLVFGKKSRNIANYSLIQTSCRHEGVQSDIQLLLDAVVLCFLALSCNRFGVLIHS